MKFLSLIERRLEQIIDTFYAYWPQPFPGIDRLMGCKIISHRGEYDNRSVFENTLPALDAAGNAGVWGIEFDVRWTRDLHPVVVHDLDLMRVFGIDANVAELNLETLRARCPQIPLLSEVIARYGRKMHLMVEIKAEKYPKPVRQNEILDHCFAGLEPGDDYHLISLTPQMFDLINFAPVSCFMPIAMWNVRQFSEIALEKHMSGVAGHYFLVSQTTLSRHRTNGQHIGTGYPRSQNCLFREINRGVEWIFSNNAGQLQAIVHQLVNSGR
jgi:glycerophosphoryl diester phosphodiesterase